MDFPCGGSWVGRWRYPYHKRRARWLSMWTASQKFCLTAPKCRIYQRGAHPIPSAASKNPSTLSFLLTPLCPCIAHSFSVSPAPISLYAQLAAPQRLPALSSKWSSNPHMLCSTHFPTPQRQSLAAKIKMKKRIEGERRMGQGRERKIKKVRQCENERVSQGLLSHLLDLDFRECKDLEFSDFETERGWYKHLLCVVTLKYKLQHNVLKKAVFMMNPCKKKQQQQNSLRWKKSDSLPGQPSSSLSLLSQPLDSQRHFSVGAKIMFCGNHAVNYRQQVPPGWKVSYPLTHPVEIPPSSPACVKSCSGLLCRKRTTVWRCGLELIGLVLIH